MGLSSLTSLFSGFWVKAALVGVAVLAIGFMYMDIRLLNAQNDTLSNKVGILTDSLNASEAEKKQQVELYKKLQNDMISTLAEIQESLKEHSKAIQGIEQKQSRMNLNFKTLLENSSESDQAVLDHHLPQFKCLFDGTCDKNKVR